MKTATKGFRRALLTAAVQAREEGTISGWELFRIRTISALQPGKLMEAQNAVVDNACAAGLMLDADAELDGFDWTSLLAFIKEFLPILLQILAIF